ncbi:hypothetical protein HY522_01585 [bacterium]|nr:hypothetical protein [bacterium]
MKRFVTACGVLVYGWSAFAAADPRVAVVPEGSDESRMVAGRLEVLLKQVSVDTSPNIPINRAASPFERRRPAMPGPDFLVLIQTQFESAAGSNVHDFAATFNLVRADRPETLYVGSFSRAVGPILSRSPEFFLFFPQALAAFPLTLSVIQSKAEAADKLAAEGADGLNAFFETLSGPAPETPRVYSANRE